jgi:hypothetical protein
LKLDLLTDSPKGPQVALRAGAWIETVCTRKGRV